MKRRRTAQCRSLSLYCRHCSSTSSGTASGGGGDIAQRAEEAGPSPPRWEYNRRARGRPAAKAARAPEVSRPHVRPRPRLAAGHWGAPPGLLRPGPARPRRPHSPQPGPAPRECVCSPSPPFSTPIPAPLSRSEPAAPASRGRAKHRETARKRSPPRGGKAPPGGRKRVAPCAATQSAQRLHEERRKRQPLRKSPAPRGRTTAGLPRAPGTFLCALAEYSTAQAFVVAIRNGR